MSAGLGVRFRFTVFARFTLLSREPGGLLVSARLPELGVGFRITVCARVYLLSLVLVAIMR